MEYLVAIISASVTILVALIGIFGNMYLANQNRKRELLIKEKEIEQEEVRFLLANLKGFWEDQGEILKQTLYTASILTFNEDIGSDEFEEAYRRIWKLIYGELPMYDVEKVEEALQQLADKAYEKRRLDPKDHKAIKDKKKEMKPFLTNLAHTIKQTSIILEYSKKLKANVYERE